MTLSLELEGVTENLVAQILDESSDVVRTLPLGFQLLCGCR